MQQPLLDEPDISTPSRGPHPWYRRLRFVDMLLWLTIFIGSLFRMESWEWGTEMVMIPLTLLSLMYFLVPHIVLGATNVNERWLSFGVGYAIALALLSMFCRIESYPGAGELGLLGFVVATGSVILMAILLIRRPSSWKESNVFRHALSRLFVAIWLTYGVVLRLLLGN